MAFGIASAPVGTPLRAEIYACRDLCEARLEAQRLHPWLHREWFQSAERRRAYRLAHRECVGYTWKRLRDFGEPHYPEGVK